MNFTYLGNAQKIVFVFFSNMKVYSVVPVTQIPLIVMENSFEHRVSLSVSHSVKMVHMILRAIDSIVPVMIYQ